MHRVTMYWSNICVLHRYEKRHIENVRKQLSELHIDLSVEYFGLGYSGKLADAVKAAGGAPDIIVSTDLDVFEEPDIYRLFCHDLMELDTVLPVKQALQSGNLCQDKRLLPFLVVPLVLLLNNRLWQGRTMPASLHELCSCPKAFGGKNNSAGKGIYKQLTYLYGEAFTRRFMATATICEMPVQSLNSVQKGLVPASLTPSIFALRADNQTLTLQYPAEGAITVPSFAAAKKSLGPELAETILSALLTIDFSNYFAVNGAIQPCRKGTMDVDIIAKNGFRLIYPEFPALS